MDSFRFYSSLWLCVIPLILLIGWWRSRTRWRPASVFSSISDLKPLPVTILQRIKRLMPLVYGIGLILLAIGLARPQSGKSESRILGEGIAIEMV